MANRKHPATVVDVGAGIAGLSTAYHLAEKGVEKVILIDKGRVGDGSSSRAGGITTMLMSTETSTRARSISLDIVEGFSEILESYEFHQTGCINL